MAMVVLPTVRTQLANYRIVANVRLPIIRCIVPFSGFIKGDGSSSIIEALLLCITHAADVRLFSSQH